MGKNLDKKLSGKVALVTGGSRGLGSAIAWSLAEQGADIAISYLSSSDKAEALVQKIKTFKSDQGDVTQAESLVQSVVQHFGSVDILVNNAALSVPGLVGDSKTDEKALDRQWAVNALGVVATIRAAAKVLRDGGRIVSIGSGVADRVGSPGMADYAGTKAAIVGYSKGAARDLAPRNITVNVVQAGLMNTDMILPYKAQMSEMLDTLAIKRFARLEEVAAAVNFLVSPEASFITGSVVDAEGGYGA